MTGYPGQNKIEGIATNQFDWYYTFFTEVFGMTVERTRGEAPNRMLWFAEGIQLNELTEPEVIGYGIAMIQFILSRKLAWLPPLP